MSDEPQQPATEGPGSEPEFDLAEHPSVLISEREATKMAKPAPVKDAHSEPVAQTSIPPDKAVDLLSKISLFSALAVIVAGLLRASEEL